MTDKEEFKNLLDEIRVESNRAFKQGRDMGLLEAKGVVLADRTSGSAALQLELSKEIEQLRLL